MIKMYSDYTVIKYSIQRLTCPNVKASSELISLVSPIYINSNCNHDFEFYLFIIFTPPCIMLCWELGH